MEDTQGKRSCGNPWLQWLLVLVVIAVLFVMAAPVVLKSHKKADVTEAVNNAKQIYCLLLEFDGEYGQFPTDATAVDELQGYRGEYSNDYLAQFFAAGYTRSEEIFYAKGGSSLQKKPDGVIDDREDQLSEGECGFAYIKDLSMRSHKETPVLLAPMYGDGYKFNTDAFEGKGVMLEVSGRVRLLRLNGEGEAMIAGGKKLFDGGEGTPWEHKPFDSSKLCYAKKPYAFTPRLLPRIDSTDVLGAVFVALLIFLVIRALMHSRSRSKDNPETQ
ncbi:MAG: hypothetical protein AB8F34_09720 [Akkermansiaceae bacterium]